MSLLPIKKEPQVANQLCWAAVSTMAISAFGDARLDALSQGDIVILKTAGIKTLADIKIANKLNPAGARETRIKQQLENASQNCNKPSNCNSPSLDLWLVDCKSTRVPAGKVLTLEHFRFEIEERGRPVPIRWQYQGKKPTNGRILTGDHALIVMGFNLANGDLRVYDPWPAASDPDPVVTPHEKWIPYNTYRFPESAAGMDALAKHEFDEFKLRRQGDPVPTGYPALELLEPQLPRRENSLAFGGDILDLPESIERVMRRHVVRNSSGRPIHGPYHVGMPIPIVPVEAVELLEAEHDTDALFGSQTSAAIVPVFDEKNRLIDSIQMLHEPGGWRPGGYSNNRIASLLCEARDMHTCERRDPKGFYLVSIPELCTFFVAHGFHGGCNVASLSKAGLKNLCGARETFADLIKQVRSTQLDLSLTKS